MRSLSRLLLLIMASSTLWGQSYNISTIAGKGLPTPASAVTVSIGNGFGVASDASGNLYIPDSTTNSVYQVSVSGNITLIAGNGSFGYAGDGGPATNAELAGPMAVAIDDSGNLYISDVGDNRIRKVVNGVISTFAGNGTFGSSGDGGPAIDAQLCGAFQVLADSSGNVYINSSCNYRIRKVSSTGTIVAIAGNGTPGYSGDGGPATQASIQESGMALDAAGDLYVSDGVDSVIRKISVAGTINTVAGNGTQGFSGDGGPALSAQFHDPSGMAVDGSGNLYVADFFNERIRKISSAGIISTVAGDGNAGFTGDGGPANQADLNSPGNVSTDANGNIYIGDYGNYRVRKVSATLVITTVAGNGFSNYSGDNGPALTAQLSSGEVVLAASGDLYFPDGANNVVRVIDTAGLITTAAGNGVQGYSGDNGSATSAQLSDPTGVAIDAAGNLYIADTRNMVVRKVANGTITTFAGDGSVGYSGDGGPATAAMMDGPSSVVVDANGNVFIADPPNNVIRKVDLSGTITTIAGNGAAGDSGDGGPGVSASLNAPMALAIDLAGNVYIADTFNFRIRQVSAATGVITTVAGDGIFGNSGDGGPATSARVGYVYGVAIDSSGNIYIPDNTNEVIRKVDVNGIITRIAGTGVAGGAGDGGPALSAQLDGLGGVSLGAGSIVYFVTGNQIRELAFCPVTSGVVPATDSNAQSISISISSSNSCQWSALSLPSWITSASSGTGTGTLALGLRANTTGADRSATISVNGLSLTVSQAFTASTFSDVVPGSYYFDAVNLLQGKSITAGCGNDGYCPNATVTRDDMAVFIVRTILGSGTFSYSPTPHFADVASTYFAFPWIQKLYELGITAGCGGTPINYCPGETVTRDQMAIFLIRARYGPTTLFTWNPTAYFSDVPSSYYAFDWIQRLYQDSVTAGCSSAPLSYCPVSPVLRGDMAIFLMRGAYNQLLPPTAPVISSISPATLAHGTTGTFAVTGLNTAFLQGATQLVFPVSSGIAVNSITVTSATTMQVSLTADAGALLQPVPVYEQTEPEEAVLPNGLVIE